EGRPSSASVRVCPPQLREYIAASVAGASSTGLRYCNTRPLVRRAAAANALPGAGGSRRNWQWVVSQKSAPACAVVAPSRNDLAATAWAASAFGVAWGGLSAATIDATA